jgi:hypothetical protein
MPRQADQRPHVVGLGWPPCPGFGERIPAPTVLTASILRALDVVMVGVSVPLGARSLRFSRIRWYIFGSVRNGHSSAGPFPFRLTPGRRSIGSHAERPWMADDRFVGGTEKLTKYLGIASSILIVAPVVIRLATWQPKGVAPAYSLATLLNFFPILVGRPQGITAVRCGSCNAPPLWHQLARRLAASVAAYLS